MHCELCKNTHPQQQFFHACEDHDSDDLSDITSTHQQIDRIMLTMLLAISDMILTATVLNVNAAI